MLLISFIRGFSNYFLLGYYNQECNMPSSIIPRENLGVSYRLLSATYSLVLLLYIDSLENILKQAKNKIIIVLGVRLDDINAKVEETLSLLFYASMYTLLIAHFAHHPHHIYYYE